MCVCVCVTVCVCACVCVCVCVCVCKLQLKSYSLKSAESGHLKFDAMRICTYVRIILLYSVCLLLLL